jgi:hypothetical protein
MNESMINAPTCVCHSIPILNTCGLFFTYLIEIDGLSVAKSSYVMNYPLLKALTGCL